MTVMIPAARARATNGATGSTSAVGEVGLAGEVRQVAGVPRRLAEARRIGFERAVVPAGSFATGRGSPGRGGLAPRSVGPVTSDHGVPAGMAVIEVANVAQAAHLVLAAP